MPTEAVPPTRTGSHHHRSHHHRSHHHRSHHRTTHKTTHHHTSAREHDHPRPSKTISKNRQSSKLQQSSNTPRHNTHKHNSKHTSRKNRSAHHTSKHHDRTKSSYRVPHRSPTGTRTGTGTSTTNVRGQGGPSSSIGPGRLEPVVILMIVLLAISAVVLLGLGIWLLAARNGWPAGLNNTGSRFWTRFLSYGTACIVLFFLFSLIILFAVRSALARTGRDARRARLWLTFFVAFAILVLILMAATALLFAINGPSFVTTIIRVSWEHTVTDGRTLNDACRIQNRYKCEGWLDNSCRACRPTVDGVYATPYGTCSNAQKVICPRCWKFDNVNTTSRPITAMSASQVDGHPPVGHGLRTSVRNALRGRVAQARGIAGCKRYILQRHREFFIPMCVYTIFLTLVLILLSWKACIDSSGRYQ